MDDTDDGGLVKLHTRDKGVLREVAVGRYDAKNKVVVAEVDTSSIHINALIRHLWKQGIVSIVKE